MFKLSSDYPNRKVIGPFENLTLSGKRKLDMNYSGDRVDEV